MHTAFAKRSACADHGLVGSLQLDVRVAAWLALVTLSGCVDAVALGTECPPLGSACLARRPRVQDDGGSPDDMPVDSVVNPATTLDAGQGPEPTDAKIDGSSVDAATGGAAFPALRNGSLEITSTGIPASTGGVLSSLAVQAAPWTSCSAPGFGPGCYPSADLRANFPVGAPTAQEQLSPTDGKSLVNASPDGTALAQTLSEPLRAGTSYAFMVDLASTNLATDLSLEVLGGSSPCFSLQSLATAGPAIPGVWTSFCVRFTPDRDFASLALAAISPQASTGTRLFIDHLRKDPRCN